MSMIMPSTPVIAFGSDNETVQVWDVINDKSITIGNHKDPVKSIAFSPSDGTQVASGSWDTIICN